MLIRPFSIRCLSVACVLMLLALGAYATDTTEGHEATAGPVEEEGEEAEASTSTLAGYVVMATIFVMFSAVFAGLTLGVMSLDTLNLEIIADSGSEPDKTYASQLLPIRRKGHHLLSTLVFGNMLCNVLVAEYCARISEGFLAFVVSTVLIVIFAEILPMAICTANSLKMGALSVPIVQVFLVLLYPVAKPLGWALDKLIHHDPGQIYDREELQRLMEVHAKQFTKESGLGTVAASLLCGAFDFSKKTVGQIMTPLHEVYMLERNQTVSKELLSEIWASGHSRIPVYSDVRENIIGILYSKDLMTVTEKDNFAVYDLVRYHAQTRHTMGTDLSLPNALVFFKSGNSHLACVQSAADPDGMQYEGNTTLAGIVTLEDVIEELIQGEIYDEDDVLPAITSTDSLPPPSPTATPKSEAATPSLMPSSFSLLTGRHHTRSLNRVHMFMFDAKPKTPLTRAQVNSVATFLQQSEESLSHIDVQIIAKVIKLISDQCEDVFLPTCAESGERDARDLGLQDERNLFLYKKGEATNFFSLILYGRVEVITGREGFRKELKAWHGLGACALTRPSFLPDYTARVVSPSRILRISYAAVSQMYELNLKFLESGGQIGHMALASMNLAVDGPLRLPTTVVTVQAEDARHPDASELLPAS